VELAAGRLLHENAGDHVSGVRVFEAFARTEMGLSVCGRVVDELDRTRCPARLGATGGAGPWVAELGL